MEVGDVRGETDCDQGSKQHLPIVQVTDQSIPDFTYKMQSFNDMQFLFFYIQGKKAIFQETYTMLFAVLFVLHE